MADRNSSSITPKSPRAALEPESVPGPPRRSRTARHPMIVAGNAVFTIVLLLLIGAGVMYVYGRQQIELPGPLAQDKVVNVPARAGTGDIADLLNREGVIDQSRTMFMAAVMLMQARSELKSGEYVFPKGASLRQVIETLVDGKVVQYTLTLAEGLTSDQIVAKLMENDILTGTVRDTPREGTMLPETYKFTRGTTRDQMIQRMQQAQKRVVQEIWERRNPDIPVKSPEQLVTLASIVEKETGRTDERSRVAAVFVNRLNKRVRLQSDPTIIYGLVGGKGTLGRPIKKSEITAPSPYNTYVVEGLPPGPIANPGRASLEATANPARTRDLFFVADGSGGHVFTENYEAHRKNVAKLRGIERQRIDAVEDDDDTPASGTATITPPASAVPAPAATPKPAAARPGGTPPKAAQRHRTAPSAQGGAERAPAGGEPADQ